MTNYAQQGLDADYAMAKSFVYLKAVRETPFTRLGSALALLTKAQDAVGSVVTNLVGEQMVGAGTPPVSPVGSGLLGSIEEMAEEVSRRAHDILEQAQRLQSRL
jgi:hypothetical protein